MHEIKYQTGGELHFHDDFKECVELFNESLCFPPQPKQVAECLKLEDCALSGAIPRGCGPPPPLPHRFIIYRFRGGQKKHIFVQSLSIWRKAGGEKKRRKD